MAAFFSVIEEESIFIFCFTCSTISVNIIWDLLARDVFLSLRNGLPFGQSTKKYFTLLTCALRVSATREPGCDYYTIYYNL